MQGLKATLVDAFNDQSIRMPCGVCTRIHGLPSTTKAPSQQWGRAQQDGRALPSYTCLDCSGGARGARACQRQSAGTTSHAGFNFSAVNRRKTGEFTVFDRYRKVVYRCFSVFFVSNFKISKKIINNRQKNRQKL